jgi:hypothetical protein
MVTIEGMDAKVVMKKRGEGICSSEVFLAA